MNRRSVWVCALLVAAVAMPACATLGIGGGNPLSGTWKVVKHQGETVADGAAWTFDKGEYKIASGMETTMAGTYTYDAGMDPKTLDLASGDMDMGTNLAIFSTPNEGTLVLKLQRVPSDNRAGNFGKEDGFEVLVLRKQ